MAATAITTTATTTTAATAVPELTEELEDVRATAVQLLTAAVGDAGLADEVETAIFDFCEEFGAQECISNCSQLYLSMYVSKARELVANLDPESYVGNQDLRSRLLAGEVTAKQLPYMTPQQLFPDNWTAIIEEKRRKDELKYNVTQQAVTDIYKCSRCGGRRITCTEVQLRSADEAATQVFSCLDCGCRWRKN